MSVCFKMLKLLWRAVHVVLFVQERPQVATLAVSGSVMLLVHGLRRLACPRKSLIGCQLPLCQGVPTRLVDILLSSYYNPSTLLYFNLFTPDTLPTPLPTNKSNPVYLYISKCPVVTGGATPTPRAVLDTPFFERQV